MGSSESNNLNNSSSTSSSSRSYTSKSLKSISVGRGNCGDLREIVGKYANLTKKIDQIIFLKRIIENFGFLHWGFFFKVDDVIVCIEYTDSGLLINLFNNLSDGFRAFASKTNIVYYKNMKTFESSGCSLDNILDRVVSLVKSNGFTEDGYSVIIRNCQHFVIKLAEPFDFNVKNANKINVLPRMFGSNYSTDLMTVVGDMIFNRDDDSIFYELEGDMDPKSSAKRGLSLAKMQIYNV